MSTKCDYRDLRFGLTDPDTARCLNLLSPFDFRELGPANEAPYERLTVGVLLSEGGIAKGLLAVDKHLGNFDPFFQWIKIQDIESHDHGKRISATISLRSKNPSANDLATMPRCGDAMEHRQIANEGIPRARGDQGAVRRWGPALRLSSKKTPRALAFPDPAIRRSPSNRGHPCGCVQLHLVLTSKHSPVSFQLQLLGYTQRDGETRWMLLRLS